jgi:hypothetical protein
MTNKPPPPNHPSSTSSLPPSDSISHEQPVVGSANDASWLVSFTAAMVPFVGFCYGHSRGATTRVVEAVVRSPVGVYGLLALPLCTLAMEKCIYDTVQAAQGIDPGAHRPLTGGFPSGGAALGSLNLIPVQDRNLLTFQRRKTTVP